MPLFRKIFNSGFCAIAIRDMYMPNLTNNFWRNINAVRSSQYRHMWQEYNNYWHGKMEQRCKGLWCNEQDIALVEFLMKYRYRDNWEREMREAYFWRWYVNILPAYIDNYGIVYDRGFSIPFICDRVMHDFGIRIDGMHTHRKMLFAHL